MTKQGSVGFTRTNLVHKIDYFLSNEMYWSK